MKRIATFFIMNSLGFKFSETYKKSPINVGVSFTNKKPPSGGFIVLILT